MKQQVFEFELGGKIRKLNFGLACWEIFCEKMQVPPGDILKAFQGPATFRAMRMVVYSAINANDYLSEVPNSVTELDSAKWLNDEPDKIEAIFLLAAQSLMPTEPVTKTSEKKSQSASGRSKK